MDTKKSRINITIPKEVHTAARVHSILNGMTMAQVVTAALEGFLAEEAAKAA